MPYRIIALLSIIAVLALAGTATAAGLWHQTGRNYDCQGAASVGIICTGDGYTLMISKTRVGVFYGEGSRPTPIWSCKAYRSMSSCLDLRP